jgi:hypothetical protein
MKRSLIYFLLNAAFLPFLHANELDLPKVTHYGLKVQFFLKEHRIGLTSGFMEVNLQDCW